MTNIPMPVHQLSVQENKLLRRGFLEVTSERPCIGVIRCRLDVMIWTVMNEGNILMVSDPYIFLHCIVFLLQYFFYVRI